MLGGGLVFGFHEAGAAAIGVNHHAAEEFEPAFVVVGLTTIVREEFDAAAHQPVHGVGAIAYQRLGKIGIDVILGDAAEIVEIVLSGVFAEIGTCDIGITQVWHDAFDIPHTVVHHPEAAAGESRIAAAL